MNHIDMLFINNYVFEHCENTDATISYVSDGGLPKTLALVRHVAVHASCLSVAREPDDFAWGKQLRFILRNIPRVATITILATAVFDIPRPSTCPLPYELFDIEAVGLGDRARLGIVDHQDTGLNSASCQPADPIIAAWNSVERKWPTWRMRREVYEMPKGGQANKKRNKGKKEVLPAPELCMLGVAFFAGEWIDLAKDGEHGRSCRLVEAKLNPAVRAAVRLENAILSPRSSGEKETSSTTISSASQPRRTRFSTTKPKGRLFLRRMSSGPLIRLLGAVEEEQQPPLMKTSSEISKRSQSEPLETIAKEVRPDEATASSSFVKTEHLTEPSLDDQPTPVNVLSALPTISKESHLSQASASSMAPFIFPCIGIVYRPKQGEAGQAKRQRRVLRRMASESAVYPKRSLFPR